MFKRLLAYLALVLQVIGMPLIGTYFFLSGEMGMFSADILLLGILCWINIFRFPILAPRFRRFTQLVAEIGAMRSKLKENYGPATDVSSRVLEEETILWGKCCITIMRFRLAQPSHNYRLRLDQVPHPSAETLSLRQLPQSWGWQKQCHTLRSGEAMLQTILKALNEKGVYPHEWSPELEMEIRRYGGTSASYEITSQTVREDERGKSHITMRYHIFVEPIEQKARNTTSTSGRFVCASPSR